MIIDDVAGLDLTINGNGATIQRSTVPGTPEFRILQIHVNAAVNGNGLTIANGKVSDSFENFGGAGILNTRAATLKLTDCALRQNSAVVGGGLYNDGGAVTLNTCTVDLNTANSGGGICNDGQLTLADSQLTNNSSFFPSGSSGGGLNTVGTATLQRCFVKGNLAKVSGGGIQNRGMLTVDSSTFDDNHTSIAGGAINTNQNPLNTAAMTLLNNTFSNNSATLGGGLANLGAILTLRNSTVSSNVAISKAGGLYNVGGTSTLQCNTFFGNSSPMGGAIYTETGGSGSATLIVRSSIFQGGPGVINLFKLDGVFTSEGFNLSNDAAGGNGNTGPGGLLTAFGDVRNTDPNLGPLQNNGGPTATHALVFPSAAIDAGDDAVLDVPFSLTSDQRGTGFVRRRGPHVDIGAYESGLSVVVTTTNDHDDGACTAADCTLREAINATNVAGSGEISFAPGVTGTIQLESGLPIVARNLSVQGPGADLLKVRRNNGGNYRIFTISNSSSKGPWVTFAGLTVTNGRIQTGNFPNDSGGGILNDRGSLLLEQCAVLGNTAVGDASYGGGIFNNEGTLEVRESTVAGNAGHFGGGVATRTNGQVGCYVNLYASTINGNAAQGGDGGGLYSEAKNSGSSMHVEATNCTISGNSAIPAGFSGGNGGGIFNFGSIFGTAELWLLDCTLSGNSASTAGGVYNHSFSATANLYLRNTILKNAAAGGNLNSTGQITSYGNNLCDDNAGGPSGSGPGGFLNQIGDIRQTDPLLGPLQNNGGRTQTHALLNGSPAINAGANDFDNLVDQRDFSRPDTNDIGAFESGGISPPVQVVSAVSRKLHGATPFDINLPLTGNVGIECRTGGGSNDYQIVVTFSSPVAVNGTPKATVDLGTATIGTGGVANGGMVNISGPVVTVPLTNVANAQKITVKLTSVTDGINISDVVIPMAIVVGDTTGNGTVNASDVSQTKLQSGQTVTASNFRSDVIVNSSINASDVSLVKSKSGTALPQ